MARSGFNLTLIETLSAPSGVDGKDYVYTQKGTDGGTALAAAVAVAVADGASPTQAHVTAINSAMGTVQGDIQLSYDTAKVTNINQIKRACDALLQAARGSGIAES